MLRNPCAPQACYGGNLESRARRKRPPSKILRSCRGHPTVLPLGGLGWCSRWPPGLYFSNIYWRPGDMQSERFAGGFLKIAWFLRGEAWFLHGTCFCKRWFGPSRTSTSARGSCVVQRGSEPGQHAQVCVSREASLKSNVVPVWLSVVPAGHNR